MKNRNIMKQAWSYARRGAAKFGGNVKEYFATSLKMAWALYKKELARKGGDIIMIAPWFIKKEFGHESMVQQVKESALHVVKSTAKANLIKMVIKHNGKEIASNEFWAPKAVCI